MVRAGAGGAGAGPLLLPEVGELRRGQRVALLRHLVLARRRWRRHPSGHVAVAPAAGQVAFPGPAPGGLLMAGGHGGQRWSGGRQAGRQASGGWEAREDREKSAKD